MRYANVGLEIDANEVIEPGARLVRDGRTVGRINSTTYSRHLMKSIALAQVTPDLTAFGTEFAVRSDKGTFTAHVVRIPFYDPNRLRTHPLEERA